MKLSIEGVVLKCILSNFICRSFRTTVKTLALENYVLAYHTVDIDHAKIL